jgi:hypothetical protein
MKTPHRRTLTRAIRQILYQPDTIPRPALKHAVPPAMLGLLLLSQPSLAQNQAQPKFVEVPRLENPLAPPIDVGGSAKPAFADIDNDGDLDVFFGANKYYENKGNATHPIFEERTGKKNPFQKLNNGGSPTLVDIDNDNDLDVFIGGKNAVTYYENTGDANQPIFEQRTEENNPLESVNESGSVLFFVDIDADNDLDIFIGNSEYINDEESSTNTSYGIVKYFENTGNINAPIFEERPETTYPFSRVKDMSNSAPHFVDIDNDDDMDAFIGSSDGTVRYYENTGTAKQANFIERTEQENPLNDVNVGDSSAPALIDIDGDSDLDAFIGTGEGVVKYYENIGTSNAPQFVERTKLDNPFGGVVDNDISLTMADIDNDGDLDAFATKYNEPVRYYQNTGNVKQPNFVERIEQDNPFNGIKGKKRTYANSDFLPPLALLDIDADGDLDAFIAGSVVEGQDEEREEITWWINYYENTGSASQPFFEERIDANPLSSRVVKNKGSHISKLYFIDADNDRDFDVFIDFDDYVSDYYENVGSIRQPVFVERLEQDNPVKNLGIESDDGDGTPVLIDVNNDGNLDAFVRTSQGTVRYYENNGYSEIKRKDEQNPFVDVVDIGYSMPILVDLDNDGDLDAFIETWSSIKYYQNTSNVNQPVFSYPRADFGERLFNQPTLVDIDNDGDLDAFINTSDGMRYYKNEGTANEPLFIESAKQDNPFFDVEVYDDTTLILADIDDDNDLDAFFNLNYYENVGTVDVPKFERNDSENPFALVKEQNEPLVDIDLVDIDNDGDLDSFIGTLSNTMIIKYYQNTGTAKKPFFEERTQSNNPFYEVKNTDYRAAHITFVDIDGDKDLDAFITVHCIGCNDNNRWYYQNVGTPDNPIFVEKSELSNLLTVSHDELEYDLPRSTWADVDNDGDQDVFISASNFDFDVVDFIHYYENTGTVNEARFEKRTKQDNPFAKLNVRLNHLTLADIDNDSDLDAFMGTNSGTVRYYENSGIINQPVFLEQTEQNNPLFDVEVGFDSTPTLVDIDGDSDLDALIGAEDGTVSYYENTGSIDQPNFVERTDSNNPLVAVKVESTSRRPILGDIDNDGDIDAFIRGRKVVIDENGEEVTRETIHYYKNIGTPNQPEFVDNTEQNQLSAEINNLDARFSLTFTLVDADNDEDLDVVIVKDSFTLIYYENQGNVDEQPNFSSVTIEEYYISGEYYSPLADVFRGISNLADLDNDGDLDAFQVSSNGVFYYENITLASNALPNPYALPKSGIYNSKREISLNCIDCEKIVYTLDGTTDASSAIEYTGPFEITADTTLNFAAIDAQGHISKVRTEQYVIDSQPPELAITFPENNQNIEDLVSIEGSAFDSETESGLERIELQMTDGTYYLTNKGDTPYKSSLTWISIPIDSYDDDFNPIPIDNNWSYDIDASRIPSGKYTIKVRALDNAGNVNENTITVKIGLAFTTLSLDLNSSAILQDTNLEVAGKLIRLPAVETDLSDLPIVLTITSPEGENRIEETVTNSIGDFKFDVSGFRKKGIYQLQAAFAGNEKLEQSESRPAQLSVGTSSGYAILIQGKVNNEEGLEPHHKTLERVYKQLKERNFKDENILSFNHKAEQVFDYESNQISNEKNEYQPSESSIQIAIENWAKDRLSGSPAPLYLIMVDHGDQEQFILNGTEEIITPTELDTWLNTLENSLAESPLNPLEEPRVVIIGACYSGSFIEPLSKSGRAIITSSRDDEVSYKGPQEVDGIRSGEYFIEALFQQLGRGEPFKTAFEKATESTEFFTHSGAPEFTNNLNNPEFLDQAVQHPLLDDNGDGQGSNVLYAIGDGQQIGTKRLGTGLDYNSNTVSNPAEVKAVTETQYLEPNESSALLWLKASGSVERAMIEIRQPVAIDSITRQSGITEQVELDIPKRFPTFNRDSDRYEYTYQNFDEYGQYHIFYYVHDQSTMKLDPETGQIMASGDISPIKRSVVYKNIEGNQPPEAVNLLYPKDGASTRTELGFYGEMVSDPDDDPVTYTLLIATDENFEQVVYKQEELRVPATYVDRNVIINDERTNDTTGLKDLTTYYWKFEAIDNFGARTASEVFSFKPDNATNGIFKSNNATLNSFSLTVNAEPLGWYSGTLQPDGNGTYKVFGFKEIKKQPKATAIYYQDSKKLYRFEPVLNIHLNKLKFQ